MAVPIIEQAKIQAQVMVPLIKTLQAELGNERANTLVRKAVGKIYRQLGDQWWNAKKSSDLGSNMAAAFASFSEGEALDYTVLKQSKNAYEIDVTRCQYAEFFKELGEPELGFLLVCAPDFPFAEGFDIDVSLSRTQTIMQGADHCDFRYELKND